MTMLPLLKGLLIGLSIAAPVGPIGILCIRRTLAKGRRFGFVSGMGAATADAFYGLIAALGLTVLMDFLLGQKDWLQGIGGLFLLYLGLQIFRSNPATDAAKARGESLLGSYTSTLFLTITNPMTIMSFLGIFAGAGIGNVDSDISSALKLVMGVFLGSAFWWLFLCLLVGWAKERLNSNSLKWVNRLSGLLVIGFGIVSVASVLVRILT